MRQMRRPRPVAVEHPPEPSKENDMTDRIYSGPECSECGYAPLIEGHNRSCSKAGEEDD